MVRILVAVLGIFNPFFSAEGRAEAPNCDKLPEMQVTGKTIAECRAAAQKYDDDKIFGDCFSNTQSMTIRAGLESECNRIVMNDVLDQRLLQLKADSSATSQNRFRSEMKLQKAFLQGVPLHCDHLYSRCEGTMWTPVRRGCPGTVYAIRAAQGELINKRELSLPEVTKGFLKIKKSVPVPYREYAKLLCGMPKDVWKGGVAPADCEDRALSSLGFSPNKECEE